MRVRTTPYHSDVPLNTNQPLQTLYCWHPHPQIPVVYPYSMDKKQGSLTCRPTPAPQVNPAAPYVEYPGQRCLQAGRLAPFDNTRRQRQLAVTINNPNECSTYVSVSELCGFCFLICV